MPGRGSSREGVGIVPASVGDVPAMSGNGRTPGEIGDGRWKRRELRVQEMARPDDGTRDANDNGTNEQRSNAMHSARRRHVSFHGAFQGDALASPGTNYARWAAAIWLLNLSKERPALDAGFFGSLGWVSGKLGDLFARLGESLCSRRRTPELLERREAVENVLNASVRQMEHEAEGLVRRHPVLDAPLRAMAMDVCDEVARECAFQENGGPYARAWGQMQSTFGMSEEDCTLCEFVFLAESFDAIERYFVRTLHLHESVNWPTLSLMLDIPRNRIGDCIQRLVRIGILDDDIKSGFEMNADIKRLWDGAGCDVERLFCRRLEGRVLPLEAFPIPREDVDHVVAMLAAKDDAPVHILLYGGAGTGKTAFARSLAAHLGVEALNVASRGRDDEKARRASLTACLGVASGSKGAFVVVDEAERLLDTSTDPFASNGGTSLRDVLGASKDKAWLNDFLERPGQRIVWITNEVKHIDKAVRRRFSHSIHFARLGARERRNAWDRLLEENKASGFLTEDRRDEFATAYDVPVAVIEKAVVQGREMGKGGEGFATVARRVLNAYVTLSRNGLSMPAKREASKVYTLDGVCMEGSAETLLADCRKLDEMMRAGRPLRPTSGNMLFYGPPGTGKTALARHIAKCLQRECMVVAASEIWGPFVGETEQKIAKAFLKAGKDGAVLVFDEADSFLYSRDNISRPWEGTAVNEFLTQLEECRGLCICTTNRRKGLDRAAMRRFAHKVEFTYAGPEQIEALYESLLAPLASAPLSERARGALRAMRRLTPGDFHAVRSRHWQDEPGSVDPETLLEDLRREVKAKLHEEGGHVGF
jgi:AAA+ superfamily predicted ATPase